MANRKDFGFEQTVGADELDAAFADLENADRQLVKDLVPVGIVSGATVAQRAAGVNLSVDIAQGVVYDADGKRVAWTGTQNKSVAADSDGLTTEVTTPGNSKIISVFAKFKRAQSDARTDGHGDPYYFEQAESFEFIVRQSAEDVAPVAPPLEADAKLLVDITRAQGQTTIVDGNLSTARRQDAVILTGTTKSIRAGKLDAAILALLGYYNDHVEGDADKHNATAIVFTPAGAWKDSSGIGATNVAAAIAEITTDLANDAGAARIGTAARSAWLGGVTNPASVSIQAALDKIVTDLSSVTAGAGADGAAKIGVADIATTHGTFTPGNVREALRQIENSIEAVSRTYGPSFVMFGNTSTPTGVGYLDPGGNIDRVAPATEAKIAPPNPNGGVVQRLSVKARTGPAGGSQTFTLRVNGVDTLATVDLAAGATEASVTLSTANAVGFAALDDLSVKTSGNGGIATGAIDVVVCLMLTLNAE
jgi:hypothetical protein